MSSLYTPVFFPPPPLPENLNANATPPSSAANPNPTDDSQSSSAPTPHAHTHPDPISSHSTRLSSIHLALSCLDPILCPPSPPQHPNDPPHDEEAHSRTLTLRAQVLELLHAADGEPSSGKWGHVSRKLRLGCTRGK